MNKRDATLYSLVSSLSYARVSYEPIEVISRDKKKSRALSTSQIVGLKSLVAKNHPRKPSAAAMTTTYTRKWDKLCEQRQPILTSRINVVLPKCCKTPFLSSISNKKNRLPFQMFIMGIARIFISCLRQALDASFFARESLGFHS